jgi:hypothetical protein
MGSIAQDKKGNMALGYSVVNGTDVYPGIRYTGRLAGEPLGTMGAIGEGTIINGTGVQLTTNSRWRLHVDEHRPGGRHVLVRERVLHGRWSGQLAGRLADENRELQAAGLLS